MVNIQYGEDLAAWFARPEFVPVRYRHVKRGTIYTVFSQGEHYLNEFSAEGSIHPVPYKGGILLCELQFSGDGTGSRYAGHITAYVGEDGKGWVRPTFEFMDGRFERIE